MRLKAQFCYTRGLRSAQKPHGKGRINLPLSQPIGQQACIRGGGIGAELIGGKPGGDKERVQTLGNAAHHIGANAILRATISSNNIQSLGNPASNNNIGDNGLTFDIRGNSDVEINIANNFIENAGDAAIGFSLQNTPFVNQPGSTRITISGNTFGSGVSTTVEADLVYNTGSPVSVFELYGSGSNELLNSNVKQQPFNSGSYPNLFVNNVQLQGNP